MRNYELVIAGETFIARRSATQHSQLRCVFDILAYTGGVFSTADIRLYNLVMSSSPRSETHTWSELNQPQRSLITAPVAGIHVKSGDAIRLLAGYDDDIGVIFTGTVTNVFREREGTNIVTRLLCRSGDSTVDTGITNTSYGAGATLFDVLTDLSRGWGKRLTVNQARAEQIIFNSGYITDGDITRALDDLALAHQFEWTNYNGRVNVSFPDDQRTSPLYTISATTGMIGIPEISGGAGGVFLDVSNRINPHIDINDRVQVSAEFQTFNTGNAFVTHVEAFATGEWNIRGMRYRGDNWGSNWRMDINAQKTTLSTTVQGTIDPGGKLIWGAKVDQEFRVAVREVAADLNIADPNWLMAVMAFETGNSFSPYIRNPVSGAVGLIQFTQVGLSGNNMRGYTQTSIARMSASEQLRNPVKDYIKPYAGRISNLGDTYMAVFAPVGIGKSDDYVLYRSPSKEYNQNSRLDKERKGYITRADCMVEVNKAFRIGQQYAAG